LALAGTAPWRLALPAMAVTHAVIGIGEALITAAVVSFVLQVRPDLIYVPARVAAQPIPRKSLLGYGLGIAAGAALLLAPVASSLPDGLEKLAQQLGFAARAEGTLAAPLADYTLPVLPYSWLSTALAAIIGTLTAFGLGWLVAASLSKWWRRSRSQPQLD
jgi:cobalt/nickel transport system permease protein